MRVVQLNCKQFVVVIRQMKWKLRYILINGRIVWVISIERQGNGSAIQQGGIAPDCQVTVK